MLRKGFTPNRKKRGPNWKGRRPTIMGVTPEQLPETVSKVLSEAPILDAAPGQVKGHNHRVTKFTAEDMGKLLDIGFAGGQIGTNELGEYAADVYDGSAGLSVHSGPPHGKLAKSAEKLHIIDTLDPLRTNELIDHVYRHHLGHVLEMRSAARRFVFDVAASTYVGEFIRDCGDLLYEHRQFAIPPYETTYIEVNIDAVIKAIGQPSTADRPGAKETRDILTGYLIHKDMVYPFARARGSYGALGLFHYRMNTPDHHGTLFDIPVFERDPCDKFLKEALLLGSTWRGLKEAERTQFAADVRIGLNVDASTIRNKWGSIAERRQKYETLVGSSCGDFRVMLAALLLLNQQKKVTTEYVPWEAKLVAGKRRVFMAHSRVVVHLKPHESVRKVFGRTLATARRAHEVQGHFRHLHLGDGCIHAWPYESEVSADGIQRWTCTKCRGRRIRIKSHVRGSGKEGFVSKRYEVKE